LGSRWGGRGRAGRTRIEDEVEGYGEGFVTERGFMRWEVGVITGGSSVQGTVEDTVTEGEGGDVVIWNQG